MYKIKTLNEIASLIYNHLTPDQFTVAKDETAPDAVIVRSADMLKTALPESVLAIARAGIGVNNIPVDDCTDKGVVVFNTPGANANAVCELAIGALVLSARPVLQAAAWAKTLKGKGAEVPALVEKGKNQFVGPELRGKKLGLFALGKIGVMVANAAVALGMEVEGYDPYMSVESAWALSRSVRRADSEEAMLTSSDYICIHATLTPETRGKFNKELLGRLKKGVVILNFARGEIVNDQDIVAAIASGQVRAYVTDFPTDALIDVPGVIAIPHLGASTPESEDNCADMAAAQTRDYLLNGNIRNSVNFPACAMPRTTATRVAVVHHNVPNMIGQVTSILAGARVNIANMINQSRGPVGYTLLDLDSDAPAAVLEKIAALEGVVRVRCIH